MGRDTKYRDGLSECDQCHQKPKSLGMCTTTKFEKLKNIITKRVNTL